MSYRPSTIAAFGGLLEAMFDAARHAPPHLADTLDWRMMAKATLDWLDELDADAAVGDIATHPDLRRRPHDADK